jgi:hypothetical protein
VWLSSSEVGSVPMHHAPLGRACPSPVGSLRWLDGSRLHVPILFSRGVSSAGMGVAAQPNQLTDRHKHIHTASKSDAILPNPSFAIRSAPSSISKSIMLCLPYDAAYMKAVTDLVVLLLTSVL